MNIFGGVVKSVKAGAVLSFVLVGFGSNLASASVTGVGIFDIPKNNEYIRTRPDDNMPLAILSADVYPTSDANISPRAYDKACFNVVPVPGTEGNVQFFKYTANLASGQSAGNTFSLQKTENTMTLTYASTGLDGLFNGYFSTFYAVANSAIKLHAYLRIASQTLLFKPPGQTNFSVESVKRTYNTTDATNGAGILIGSNTLDPTLTYVSNKVPFQNASGSFITNSIYFPNVAILEGTPQQVSYGINFSKLAAPKKIKIDVYRIANSNWVSKQTDSALFQRLDTIEIPAEPVTNLPVLANIFVKYEFPKTTFWDTIQSDDNGFSIKDNYNCQYALKVTLEYALPDGSTETKTSSFRLNSGVSPVNFIKKWYFNKSEVLNQDAVKEYVGG